MIVANFIDGFDEITSSKLHQWDYGQKLYIYGLTNIPEIVEVHFCDKTCDKTLVRIANKVDEHLEVAIPDTLLENEFSINAFIYLKSPTEGETVKTIHIPVIPRKEPNEFVCPSDPTVDDKLTELLNDIAQLSSKFARVYGLDDRQLSIKVCDEEPTEKNPDYLYIYPDTKYDDLKAKVDQSLEDIKNGTIEVAKAKTAETATSAESSKTSLYSDDSHFADKSALAQKINYYSWAVRQDIVYVSSDSSKSFSFTFPNMSFTGNPIIEAVFVFRSGNNYRYERVMIQEYTSILPNMTFFKLDYSSVANNFSVKVEQVNSDLKFTIDYYFNSSISSGLSLEYVYLLPIKLNESFSPTNLKAPQVTAYYVDSSDEEYTRETYYLDIKNTNSLSCKAVIDVYVGDTLKKSVTTTSSITANSILKQEIAYYDDGENDTYKPTKAIVKLIADGYVDSSTVTITDFPMN